ncbi:MAG: POTRA domain-containing protein [Bacteroidota bacterium]|nr:POTRA domain-containing protein [Bacteroidota bacterium]
MKKWGLIISIMSIGFVVQAQHKLPVYSIKIEGNKVTKKDVIIRELSFEKGDSLTVSELILEIQQSEKNLKNMQLFNFLKITFLMKNNNRFNIKIVVVEQWYVFPYPILEVSERNFNVWWDEFKASNYSDFSRVNYGVFLNWRNFRGKNEILKLKFRRGFKEHYLAEYNIPYINKRKTFGLKTKISLFRRKKSFYKTENNQLEYYQDEGYSTKDIELGLELKYKRKIQTVHLIGISYFKTIVSDSIVLKNPDFFTNKDDISTIGDYYQLKYTYHYENRDYSQYPLDGNSIMMTAKKNIPKNSPVKHIELTAKVEHYLEPFNDFFLGTSFEANWSSNEYQPYFVQRGFGFGKYVRGYEYYVISGQKYWLSKTAVRHPLIDKITFEIPYIKINQFRKAHITVYMSIFSDLGYIIDTQQNNQENPLSNILLWGRGVSIDFITYYDRIITVEYSLREDKLSKEKGIFLHFSSSF